ncbi:MAG: DUF4398 domain-containing protein [Myxococcales bacterium]|nr:DUF4398 domain-containing protein [Myxococcales bacterium]
MKTWIGASLFSSALVGCASAQMPDAELTEAKSAVRAAEAVGVENAPQARLHLKMASNQIEEARRHVEDGNEAKARNALERAQYDAELALSLAQAQRTLDELKEAKKEIAELQERLQGDNQP